MLSSASIERPQPDIEQRKSLFGHEQARIHPLIHKFEDHITYPVSSVATDTSVAAVRTTFGTECYSAVRKKERMSACLFFLTRSSMTTPRYLLKASPVLGMILGETRPATSNAEMTDSTSYKGALFFSEAIRLRVPEPDNQDHVRSPSGRS